MADSTSNRSTDTSSTVKALKEYEETILDESIENALATQLSISALDLSIKNVKSEKTKKCCSTRISNKVHESDLFPREINKFQLHSISSEAKDSRWRKPKSSIKLGSASLFDLFSSSPQPIGLINIRDVLESPHSQVLENCYSANIEDLIVGFNTTELEIEQLSSLIFDNLVLESSSIAYDDNLENCYLDLHVKWIKDSVSVEECQLFAFQLLRNVILSLQHEKVMKNKDRMILCVLQMLEEYIKMWNDGLQFQKSTIQIIFFIIEVFFKRSQLATGICTAFAFHDAKNKLFLRLLSCLSSPLILCRIGCKTKLMETLYSIVSKISSIKEEKLVIDVKIEGKKCRESLALEYFINLIHYLLVNHQLLLCSYHNNESLAHDNNHFKSLSEITREQGFKFLGEIEQCRDVFEGKEHMVYENDVKLRLKPFFTLLEIGLNPELSYLFQPKMIYIVKDCIVKNLDNVWSLDDAALLQNVLKPMEELLKRIPNISKDEKYRGILFHVDKSNIVKLSPTPSCLLKVYKSFFLNYALRAESSYMLYMEKQMESIVKCLHSCLDSSQQFGKIDTPIWDDLISILLLFTTNQKHTSEMKDLVMSLLVDYEMKTSQQCVSVESIMLIYCILHNLNELDQSDYPKSRFISKIKSHCYGRYFMDNTQVIKRACSIHYDSLLNTLYPNLLNGPESIALRLWVKELMLVKILKTEITENMSNLMKK